MVLVIFQFVIVASVVVGSVVVDVCRVINNNAICAYMLRCGIPLICLALLFYYENIIGKYKARIETDISEVLHAVSEPYRCPSISIQNKRHSNHRSHSTDDVLDADCYDELFSEDLSSVDYSNESFEWENQTQPVETTGLCAAEVLEKSIRDPRALVGWKISIEGYEQTAVVLAALKRPFTTTKFQVQFEDGSVQQLKLKRSASKGKVPFTLIEKYQ